MFVLASKSCMKFAFTQSILFGGGTPKNNVSDLLTAYWFMTCVGVSAFLLSIFGKMGGYVGEENLD